MSAVESEARVREFRRACYFNQNVNKGTRITENMISCLRPAHGIPANKYFDLIGSVTKEQIDAYVPLSMNMFK